MKINKKIIKELSDYLNELISSNDDYYLCTLHRRENINNFQSMWEQLNQISENKTIIYIKHPSVPNSEDFLGKNIIKLDPMTYQDMVFAINNSKGLISDSGGLQEEAICLNKNILICQIKYYHFLFRKNSSISLIVLQNLL